MVPTERRTRRPNWWRSEIGIPINGVLSSFIDRLITKYSDSFGVDLKRVSRGVAYERMRVEFPLMRSYDDIVSEVFRLFCVGCRR